MYRSVFRPALFLLLILFGAELASQAQAQGIVRVPQDIPTLQQALDQRRTVGGIIELAQGTYAAPGNGFRLRNPQAELTVRAAAGATVVLDGGGSSIIFDLEVTNLSNRPRIFFQDLIFRNGFSDREKKGGAVSVVAGRASFVSCRFEDSRSEAPSTGGGAVLIFDDADVVFIDSEFSGNSAQNRGGAVSVVFSTAEIHDSVFTGNRTNLAGHANTAPGGALYILDSKVRVATTHFENNQAGWVGGAIYVFGDWREPLANPAAEVQIFDSNFVGNRAANHPCCVPPGATAGGAVHVEDHATVRIYRSELMGNRAESGGALDAYRAEVEIFDSVLEGNFTEPQNRPQTFGGAIFLASSDFNDASTQFGLFNRRPASLRLDGSLVDGSLASGEAASQNGGCIAAVGDLNRRFGTTAVDPDGTVEENRARITARGTIFSNCESEGLNQGGDGLGGAVNLRLTAFTARDSLFLDSQCRTDNCGGGAMAASNESLVDIAGSSFAGNAAHRGGAIFLGGSTIQLRDTLFSDNRILTPGGTSDIRDSRGAALFAIPGFSPTLPERESDADGVVQDCTFANNQGVPLFDVDVDDGPHNNVRYNNNRFGPTGFGNKVYVNRLIRASGESVAELNALVVNRTDGTSVDKSSGGNQSLGSAPVEGQLVAAPPALSPEVPGGTIGRTHLGFAWSGSNARLGSQNLAQRSGVQASTVAGRTELRSGATLLDAATLAAAPCSVGPLLCLNQDRFKLGVDWQTPRNEFGPGLAVPLTNDTGYFFFFNESNVELVVKMLRGCGVNQHFWAFAGGLTNVKTQLRVVDSFSGRVQIYDNPQRTAFQPIQDTGAFRSCTANDPTALLALAELLPLPEPMGTSLTLNEDRFEVQVSFRTPQGQEGNGQAIKLTSDTGYFFFFEEDNVELVVKVLRGCGVNNHYWVFAGGLTNVEVDLTITDTQTGDTQTYSNPLRTPFQPIQDTEAFATCP
ncbi:MAG: hypothetical protein SX243_04290 [Acidobacteriota bacterium]|nr:hypothetical protein [Acidobacteriota bacterium]